MGDEDTDKARAWFAEDLRVVAPVVHEPAIIDAFANVPREKYLGKGPWWIQPRQFEKPAYQSQTADPAILYHDVLVSIDHELGLNNGLPSLWAYYFDQLAIRPGATVLQVGAGVGYFTAVLAELVTSTGRVIAYEIEDALAKRARDNLAGYPNVEVISGDATKAEHLPYLDAIVVYAGATHIPDIWLGNLAPTGRVVIPITKDDMWGFTLLLEKRGGKMPVSSLGPCGFYPCEGARSPSEAAALSKALNASKGAVPTLDRLHKGAPKVADEMAWYVGDGFWISKT